MKPSDITKQSEGAGGIKWAKEVFEQEIKPGVKDQPLGIIKLIRKIWADAFGEGQRYREKQIIEHLESRIAKMETDDRAFHEANQILKFVKGFELFHR